MSAYKFGVSDGNIILKVDWTSSATTFLCWGNPDVRNDNIPATGSSPYFNEQGTNEQDNGVATIRFPDNSTFRVRVLFVDRNDHSIFSQKGDVIVAYKGPGRAEGSWYNVGNVVTGAKAVG